MNTITTSLIVTVLLAMIGVVADAVIRISGNGAKFIDIKWFIIGAVLYCATAFGWFYVMKYLKFSTIGVFYGISSLLILTIVGVVFFKESLNMYEMIGIGLAIISMVLLGKFA